MASRERHVGVGGVEDPGARGGQSGGFYGLYCCHGALLGSLLCTQCLCTQSLITQGPPGLLRAQEHFSRGYDPGMAQRSSTQRRPKWLSEAELRSWRTLIEVTTGVMATLDG